MDTLNARNAFADTSRDEEDTGFDLILQEEAPSQNGEVSVEDAQKAFLKLAHAM